MSTVTSPAAFIGGGPFELLSSHRHGRVRGSARIGIPPRQKSQTAPIQER